MLGIFYHNKQKGNALGCFFLLPEATPGIPPLLSESFPTATEVHIPSSNGIITCLYSGLHFFTMSPNRQGWTPINPCTSCTQQGNWHVGGARRNICQK